MLNELLIKLLDYVQYILILSLTIGIIRYKYLKKETRVVFYYILLGIFFECLTRYLGYLKFRNILPLLHLYTVLEFSLIWLFFYQFFNSFYSKKGMVVLLCTFVLLAILNAIFLQNIFSFNTNVRSMESILVIALSLLAFYKIINELDTRDPTQQPVFWIGAGFLVYFAGNLVVFSLSNYFSKNNHLLSVSYGIHAILMVILHCFFSVGLWKTKVR